MKVVILAGGRSERMRPIEDKPLLKICGKELICHQIEIVSSVGLHDFVIVGNDNNIERLKVACEKMKEWLPDLNFEYGVQVLPEGSAGAMKAVQELIKDDAVLFVSANDILDRAAYERILEQVRQTPDEAVFLAKKVEKYFPGGYLMLNEEGLLQRIVEKPGEGNEPSDLMNIFVHYHPHGGTLCQALYDVQDIDIDLYLTAVKEMAAQGLRINVIHYQGVWQAVKYPWDVLEEMKVLFSQLNQRIDGEVSAGAVIEGDVIVEKGAIVEEGTRLKGPVFIGRNSVVRKNSVIENSFIGAECVLGPDCRVIGSNLGDGIEAEYCEIMHSIIGNNVKFASGVTMKESAEPVQVMIKENSVNSGRKELGIITGNDIRIGDSVHFEPGKKLGNNTFILSNSKVKFDIADNHCFDGDRIKPHSLDVTDLSLAELPERVEELA